MQYNFGTGQLFALPVGGGAPLKVGALQDVSVEFSGDNQELYGQFQFPLDVARGKTKITGKATAAAMSVDLYNQIYFGGTATTGQTKTAYNEAAMVPATTTYTITVSNAAHFVMDLGVVYAATGVPLVQVASGSEAIGKYSVSAAGVYTFAVADASANVLITYFYTDATSGKTLQLTNGLMGNTPKFQAVMSEVYEGKFMSLVLYSCVSSKLSFPLKQDKYTIPEFDFSAQDNGSGSIGYISISG